MPVVRILLQLQIAATKSYENIFLDCFCIFFKYTGRKYRYDIFFPLQLFVMACFSAILSWAISPI